MPSRVEPAHMRHLEKQMRSLIASLSDANPHPNPRVAAAVLSAGSVVGRGLHRRAGEPHAEILALRAAGDRARASTVVVTLEPCSHHGRTPPCADALISAGVGRVVVGARDPDPRVAGGGIARLRAAGIEVLEGVLGAEVEAADPGYFHQRRTGRPLMTLKLASTLDGQLAAADGTSQWITGEAARRDVHRLRSQCDAVMVGAGTVLADDPRLDVRIEGFDGPQPRPVIIAGSRPLPPGAALFDRNAIVYAPRATDLGEGVEAPGPDGVSLDTVVKDLGSRGVLRVLVEGGPTLAAALWRAGLVDEIVAYLGGTIAGGLGQPWFAAPFTTLSEAIPVTLSDVTQLDGDVRLTARIS